jgi:hypothetical protein
LLGTDEAKATQLLEKMKTGIHMIGHRQGEVVIFIDRTPLGTDEAKATHPFE